MIVIVTIKDAQKNNYNYNNNTKKPNLVRCLVQST